MNREQMIAWLTLEGWEPYGSCREVWVHRDETAAYACDTDGLYEEGTISWSPALSCFGQVDWSRFSAGKLRRICEVLNEEKDHGKLE